MAEKRHALVVEPKDTLRLCDNAIEALSALYNLCEPPYENWGDCVGCDVGRLVVEIKDLRNDIIKRLPPDDPDIDW